MQTTDNPPAPLEQTDPELAEHLRLVATRQHPVLRTIAIDGDRIMLRRLNGTWHHRVIKPLVPPGRNDPCPCGSGKKFKRCCVAA